MDKRRLLGEVNVPPMVGIQPFAPVNHVTPIQFLHLTDVSHSTGQLAVWEGHLTLFLRVFLSHSLKTAESLFETLLAPPLWFLEFSCPDVQCLKIVESGLPMRQVRGEDLLGFLSWWTHLRVELGWSKRQKTDMLEGQWKLLKIWKNSHYHSLPMPLPGLAFSDLKLESLKSDFGLIV